MTDPIVYTRGASTDHWETPPQLFELASRAFAEPTGFALDAAANAANTLAPRWLGPGGLSPDALSLDDWPLAEGQAAWMNPPYSKLAGPLARWVERADEVASEASRRRVVCLLKADTSTKWFRFAAARAWRIVFLQPRVRHLLAGHEQATPPWGSLLAVFDAAQRGEARAIVTVAYWRKRR